MILKALVVAFSIVSMTQVQCSFTIGGGDGTETVKLSVPHYTQECYGWCGVACVQMWAGAESIFVTQSEIASYLGGVGPNGTAPRNVERAVGAFTCEPGWLERRHWSNSRGKGDLIASTITGVENGIPSIMPFFTDHAVIMVGYKWSVETDGRPVALKAWYHNPSRNIEYLSITPGFLTSYFDCNPEDNWVIVGHQSFVWDGISGHDDFIAAGGTYYGGPDEYNPDDLVAQQ